MIELHYPLPVNQEELVVFRIGKCTEMAYDYSWLEQEGEIVLKIVCSDGIFLVAKLPLCYEDDESFAGCKKEDTAKQEETAPSVLGGLRCSDQERCECQAGR